MGRIIFLFFVLALAISGCIPLPATQEISSPQPPGTLHVYFLDTARFQVGIEPYEMQVTRDVPVPFSPPEAVLVQLFAGPTQAEKAQGLAVILSGATGFSKMTVENGVARVYLTGACASNGSTYTIANLIFRNIKQFPEILWIKIYDPNGATETPDGPSNSIPICLEP